MEEATLEEAQEEITSEFEVEESQADDVAPVSYEDTDTNDGDTESNSNSDTESNSNSNSDENEDTTDDETGEKKPRRNHSLEEMQAEFAAVQAELEATKAELETLREFKLGIENQQKDELISKYHMLSDEARNEISEHKSEYTIEEIEAKLALAFVKENVDFSEVDGKKVEEEAHEDPITTFSLDAAVDTEIVSPVLQALRDAKND